MPIHDLSSTRLFVDAPLVFGGAIALDRAQQNYLGNVLRLRGGDRILVFNGRDGEFAACLVQDGRRVALSVEELRRPQPLPQRLRWLFAPLKHARLDYMVQKAVELGAGTIEPVITRHTQVARVNLDRMRANALEAAEQCGILAIPHVQEDMPLTAKLAGWDPAVPLVFCDEDAPLASPLAALRTVTDADLAVLIGPEGGFDESERALLLGLPTIVRLSLGPRILRADTAAVAALTLVQAIWGDWTGGSPA
jgi:16S rRNA (uracil1498-N3)-methyltransferase